MTIKEARLRKGYTQDALSRLLDLGSQATVWHWETGKTRPTKANLRKLCRILGVEERELELKERTR